MIYESKYKPEFCDIAYHLMCDGMSRNKVCAELVICKQTLYNWEKEYPEFSMAMKLGEVASEAHWEELGAAAIVGGDGFNTGMYMIQMRNRFKWRATDPKDEAEIDKSNATLLTDAFIAASNAINEVNKMKENDRQKTS